MQPRWCGERLSESPVSILIRPFDRMQRGRCTRRHRRTGGFNPHPAFRPDATAITTLMTAVDQLFQSSSGLSTGCNLHISGKYFLPSRFQSSSGLSTGCNSCVWFSYLSPANLHGGPLNLWVPGISSVLFTSCSATNANLKAGAPITLGSRQITRGPLKSITLP